VKDGLYFSLASELQRNRSQSNGQDTIEDRIIFHIKIELCKVFEQCLEFLHIKYELCKVFEQCLEFLHIKYELCKVFLIENHSQNQIQSRSISNFSKAIAFARRIS